MGGRGPIIISTPFFLLSPKSGWFCILRAKKPVSCIVIKVRIILVQLIEQLDKLLLLALYRYLLNLGLFLFGFVTMP